MLMWNIKNIGPAGGTFDNDMQEIGIIHLP